MENPNILIVEDDQEINNLIGDALKREDYNVVLPFDARQALDEVFLYIVFLLKRLYLHLHFLKNLNKAPSKRK